MRYPAVFFTNFIRDLTTEIIWKLIWSVKLHPLLQVGVRLPLDYTFLTWFCFWSEPRSVSARVLLFHWTVPSFFSLSDFEPHLRSENHFLIGLYHPFIVCWFKPHLCGYSYFLIGVYLPFRFWFALWTEALTSVPVYFFIGPYLPCSAFWWVIIPNLRCSLEFTFLSKDFFEPQAYIGSLFFFPMGLIFFPFTPLVYHIVFQIAICKL